MLKVRVVGQQGLISRLKRASEQTKKAVITEYAITAKLIESDAKRATPVNLGRLRAANYSRGTNTGAVVGNNALYAPFIEFGTKGKVKVPRGYEALAAPYRGFKGNGGLQGFLDSLTLWAKRKGIDENAVFPIMRAILKNGIKPQPFLIPALKKHVPELRKKVRQIIMRQV
jgi:hypothetical protein